MSAVAMILTAAMAVPADLPEKVSGEMVQGLDLSREWEGTLRSKQGKECRVRIDPKWIFLESDEGKIGLGTKNLVDEGNGKLRFRGSLGLYRYEKDRLLICIGDGKSRPLTIGQEYGSLLILHRAKSRK